MRKIVVTIILLLMLILLLYTFNNQKNDFKMLEIEEENRFCYPNAYRNDDVKFKVKIVPKDKMLIELIGNEVKLIKGNKYSYNDVFEIKANTTKSISGIITTDIPKNQLDKIPHGFKNFDIVLHE